MWLRYQVIYQLDECLFDYLRAFEDSGDGAKPKRSTDIGALYALGIGVILHAGDAR